MRVRVVCLGVRCDWCAEGDAAFQAQHAVCEAWPCRVHAQCVSLWTGIARKVGAGCSPAPVRPCSPVQRGKDGHLTLNAVGTGDDFFSNPLGGGNLSGRQGSLGTCRALQQGRAFLFACWTWDLHQWRSACPVDCRCVAPQAAARYAADCCHAQMPRLRSLGRADKGPAFGGSRGFGASSAAAKKPADEGPGLAQQRFGNAKSISSSAFHGEQPGGGELKAFDCTRAALMGRHAGTAVLYVLDLKLPLSMPLGEPWLSPAARSTLADLPAWLPAGRDNAESEYEKQQRLSQFQVGLGWAILLYVGWPFLGHREFWLTKLARACPVASLRPCSCLHAAGLGPAVSHTASLHTLLGSISIAACSSLVH